MLKSFAMIFGIVLIAMGIFGFMPSMTPDGLLLGYFHVNAVHNIIHILSGAVGLWAGITSTAASRIYFQVFGVVYGLVAILGFYFGDADIFGILANNKADNFLHTGIAVISLYLGFLFEENVPRVEK